MEKVFWLIDGKLAGREGPGFAPWTLTELRDGGINTIMTLGEGLCDTDEVVASGLRHFERPLPDVVPADDSVERACLESLPRTHELLTAELNADRTVLVHCAAGQDRTGLLLAYHAALSDGLSASDAIARVRRVRPTALSAEGWERMALRVLALLLERG